MENQHECLAIPISPDATLRGRTAAHERIKYPISMVSGPRLGTRRKLGAPAELTARMGMGCQEARAILMNSNKAFKDRRIT
ncbi:MAG: hypothetical protein GXY44_16855 [Phycisphaerales bacterium]|nr:hypothetical protein [Phycisphaerales bacterium]